MLRQRETAPRPVVLSVGDDSAHNRGLDETGRSELLRGLEEGASDEEADWTYAMTRRAEGRQSIERQLTRRTSPSTITSIGSSLSKSILRAAHRQASAV